MSTMLDAEIKMEIREANVERFNGTQQRPVLRRDTKRAGQP